MNLEQLRRKRAELLAQAETRRVNGAFPDDQARASFDQDMAQVRDLDTQIAAAERAAVTPPAVVPTPAAAGNTEAVEAARTQERARVDGIMGVIRAANLGDAADALQTSLIRGGQSLDQARAAVLDTLATRTAATRTDGGGGGIVPGEDARDKQRRGMIAALVGRTNGLGALLTRAATLAGEQAPTLDPGEFRGMSLVDMARECLESAGVKVRGMDRSRLIGLAFTHTRDSGHSTSDFAVLLENLMHKALQAEYALADDTHSKWVGVGTVSDFRAHNRYRFGLFGSLDSLSEKGEFKYKAISDAEKATIALATKGNIIGISRQMVINDDMEAFTRLPRMLGRAGKLSEEVDAYALLLQNSGLGPTQADGQPLFHANRSNVGTGAAFAVDAIDSDRQVLASQKDPNGNEYLNIRPAVILVPLSLGGKARITNNAQYDVDASNKFQVPNKVAGLFRDVVDTPRLTGTRRYMFGDPGQYPVFEKVYLDGQSNPVIETKDGWHQDGTELRIRHDYAIGAIDFRGAVTNAGA
jgi:hypothetical protein